MPDVIQLFYIIQTTKHNFSTFKLAIVGLAYPFFVSNSSNFIEFYIIIIVLANCVMSQKHFQISPSVYDMSIISIFSPDLCDIIQCHYQ